MAGRGVLTGGGGVLGMGGEGEGVAGGVVGGDVVVGEWGGWSSRGVDGRAGDSVQRGKTDEASAQSITIAHGVWILVRGERCWKNAVRGMRATAAHLSFDLHVATRSSPSANNDRLQMLELHARPVETTQRTRRAAMLAKVKVGGRVVERFDAVTRSRNALLF